ncbi:hypothetical protein CHS0354_007049 [Potamilus streckersoni]|uniref:DOMON domain-containing protein n=1 Tax=Potamilus streckersoni TaxID=2493646 RepID=A0AAE0VTY4_9BIVA|nr:hypothetical protein CHS0354_007049 [Potamilus streckersoni]
MLIKFFGQMEATRLAANSLLCLLLHIVLLPQASCFLMKSVCRHLEVGVNDTIYNEVVFESASEDCPLSTQQFAVYTISKEKNNTGYETEVFLFCWTKHVWRFAVQFAPDITLETQHNHSHELLSCAGFKDVIYVGHKRIRKEGAYHMTLELSRDQNSTSVSSTIFRAFVDFKKFKGHRHHKVIQYINYAGQKESWRKNKRSASQSMDITDPVECGKTRGCFRFGEKDCQHFQCQYFMSYRFLDGDVDLEISAKTPGWVAVGFSSDANMGGDDVIACHITFSASVQVGYYKNPYAHNHPVKQTGDTFLTITKTEYKDGYVYCRVRRADEVEGMVDLSNDWYQLYTWGPISPGGFIEKHTERPMISERFSMRRLQNVQTSAVSKTYCQFITRLNGLVALVYFINRKA